MGRSRIPGMTSLQPPVATTPPRSQGSAFGFLAVQVVVLAAAHAFGGPPWVILGVLACLGQIMADFRLASLLPLVPALLWAFAQAATGNRELFFPYAIYLAAHVVVTLWPRGFARAAAAGAGLVGAFLLIRLLQRATPGVLAVEAAVAASILMATLGAAVVGGHRLWGRWLIPLAASLAAYAGLAF